MLVFVRRKNFRFEKKIAVHFKNYIFCKYGKFLALLLNNLTTTKTKKKKHIRGSLFREPG